MIANRLPEMRHQDTGVKVDHYQALKAEYMAHGTAGINMYMKQVTGTTASHILNQG